MKSYIDKKIETGANTDTDSGNFLPKNLNANLQGELMEDVRRRKK